MPTCACAPMPSVPPFRNDVLTLLASSVSLSRARALSRARSQTPYSDGKDWKSAKKKAEKDLAVGGAFFDMIRTDTKCPADSMRTIDNFGKFQHGMLGAVNKVRQLRHHCSTISHALYALRHATRAVLWSTKWSCWSGAD